jgi:prepilin-type N-terminal cleavage/methylation domain-containing protein
MRETQRHPRAGGQDGMTVIEVMAAMVILLVGVLGVISLLDIGQRVTSESRP